MVAMGGSFAYVIGNIKVDEDENNNEEQVTITT
jgi:hypothetical protein